MFVCVYVCICTYIYIYIYASRDRSGAAHSTCMCVRPCICCIPHTARSDSMQGVAGRGRAGQGSVVWCITSQRMAVHHTTLDAIT